MKRYHHKVRTGCSQCRKRRVKCDEVKPICTGCVRNRLQCNLGFLTPVRPQDRRLHDPYSDKSLFRSPEIYPLGTDAGLVGSPMDLRSMELMHHFTASVCLDLGTRRNMEVWQIEIPRLALAHPFVMQGLLAISALHLATLQPARTCELVKRAAAAETRGLPSFRKFVKANTPGSMHAMFAFAGFLPPYVLLQSRFLNVPMGRIPSLDDDRPHWFFVLRGLTSLLAKGWKELVHGPFAPLLVRSHSPVDCTRNPDDVQFTKIYSLLQPKEPTPMVAEHELLICRLALDELRRVSALPYSPCKTLEDRAVGYIWPGSVTDSYIELVHRRKPEALIILAHFCVQIKSLDWVWYFKGVGKAMLEAIDEELGDEWKPWIAWALEQPVQSFKRTGETIPFLKLPNI